VGGVIGVAGLSFPRPAVRLRGDDDPRRRKTMKYLLLIQNFGLDKWESFSEDEKSAIYDEFQALAATPRRQPRLSARASRGGHHGTDG
jgi:hypothetical protein